MNASEPREDAVAVLRECIEWMEVAQVRREDDAPPIARAKAAMASLAALLAQQGAVAVAWQCRHRGSKAKPWSEWEECDHDSYVDITRRQPVMWEARALIPATGAPR